MPLWAVSSHMSSDASLQSASFLSCFVAKHWSPPPLDASWKRGSREGDGVEMETAMGGGVVWAEVEVLVSICWRWNT